ncbi:MAG TPA: RNA methyltransferase [Acidimicrobiales bacterium]|nr:RNA methyltransferase [Acidimicrobiales bacterium]
MAEGVELARTALAAGAVPDTVYVAADAAADPAVADLAAAVADRGLRLYELAPGVVDRVADTVTPQPVLAVFPMLHRDLDAVAARQPGGTAGLVVVMVDVRDPGNAGTVLRTADAAGAAAVVCCGGTVDPYNPKTVRSSAGSLFHVPLVVAGSPDDTLDRLGRAGFRRLGTAVRGGDDYAAVDWTVPTALVLGNEAAGLPDGLPLDGTVGIPMAGRAESLNVGMACAVLCFEALRQRRTGPGRRPTMPR